MARDSRRMRGARPFVFTNLRTGEGVDAVLAWLRDDLLLEPAGREGGASRPRPPAA